ncbi:PREDICTED: pancreatic lipase-related protein 3-like [Crocodylus porosus]|uniref:pancreatic lipase-related protein 3-like n=1 Tax=Crocodylus porosus TaxID=8502 RepID=UPI00093E6D10|nr:PREDICTED: pancreatic lipase-related protein 3-like [Crocodylus porosus]
MDIIQVLNSRKTRRYSPSQVHIIGHSLGAHAAAEAGRRIKGIKRITGLDPAGMFFEGAPPEVRLDPSDALLVDVIHSNAALSPVIGFGMYKATGDLDFYPNGGHLMPGCDQLVNWEDADSESFVDVSSWDQDMGKKEVQAVEKQCQLEEEWMR